MESSLAYSQPSITIAGSAQCLTLNGNHFFTITQLTYACQLFHRSYSIRISPQPGEIRGSPSVILPKCEFDSMRQIRHQGSEAASITFLLLRGGIGLYGCGA